jgi:hypothetical protein
MQFFHLKDDVNEITVYRGESNRTFRVAFGAGNDPQIQALRNEEVYGVAVGYSVTLEGSDILIRRTPGSTADAYGCFEEVK